MAYLLDTNALIWSFSQPAKLGAEVVELLTNSANDVAVSIVSLWEIIIKQSSGKLKVSDSFVSDIEQVGFRIIGLNLEYLEDYASLPLHHRDPFDRMIISTARCENMQVITSDKIFKSYEAKVIYLKN